jgi:hypothetical protein
MTLTAGFPSVDAHRYVQAAPAELIAPGENSPEEIGLTPVRLELHEPIMTCAVARHGPASALLPVSS